MKKCGLFLQDGGHTFRRARGAVKAGRLKRTLAMALTLTLLLAIVPASVASVLAADPTGNTGAPDTSWYTANPDADWYDLSTADQLAGLALLVNDNARQYRNWTIYLTADIDLSCYPNWTPIGLARDTNNDRNRKFWGTFDGQGHIITGLNANWPSTYYVGLFGIVGVGTVKNLNVTGDVLGLGYVGGIVGYCGNYNRAAISNCTFSGSVRGAGSGGITYAYGGIAGFAYADIDNCKNFATITAGGSTSYTGGIVGQLCNIPDATEAIVVRDCVNAGPVQGPNYDDRYVGGIVGSSHYGNTIINCANIGAVTSGGYVGGILGFTVTLAYSDASNTTSIDSCINTGTVSAIGMVNGENAGGILGYATIGATVRSCVNTGAISAAVSRAGGIVGCFNNLSSSATHLNVTVCYNTGSVSGGDNIGGIMGYLGSFILSADCLIDCCYNVGAVTATGSGSSYAGLLGYVATNAGGRADIYNSCYLSGPAGWHNTSGSYSSGYVHTGNLSAVSAANFYAANALNNAMRPVNIYGGYVQRSPAETCCGTVSFRPELTAFYDMAADSEAKILLKELSMISSRGTSPATLGEGEELFIFQDGQNGSDYDHAYRVVTAGQLSHIRKHPNSYFRQANNIDLSGVPNWTPIGHSIEPVFNGHYYGDGYKITNLNINRPDWDYVGLFGRSSGWIVGVDIANASVTGQSMTGGVVGVNQAGGTVSGCTFSGDKWGYGVSSGGIAGQNEGVVTDCTVKADANVSGADRVGGLVGLNSGSGDVRRSTVEKINVFSGADGASLGGVVGYNEGQIRYCASGASVYTLASAGSGLCGGVAGVNWGQILHCANTGDISSPSAAGGVAGINYNIISDCENTGKVVAGYLGGGIAGENMQGFVSTVEACVNRGEVYSGASAYCLGGIVGLNGGAIRMADVMEEDGVTVNRANVPCVNYGYIHSVALSASVPAVGGVAGLSRGVIDGARNEGDVYQAYWHTGGIAGLLERANGHPAPTLSNCYNTGRVTGGADRTGGLAGAADSATLSDSFNTGPISGGYQAGGLVGWLDGGSVSGCFNMGSVNVSTRDAGGAAGALTGNGHIENCYNNGQVTGDTVIGGLVGWLDSGTLEYCYNSGEVGAVSRAGYLVGAGTSALIGNSYDSGRLKTWSALGDAADNAAALGLPTSALTAPNALSAMGLVEPPWFKRASGGADRFCPELTAFAASADTAIQGYSRDSARVGIIAPQIGPVSPPAGIMVGQAPALIAPSVAAGSDTITATGWQASAAPGGPWNDYTQGGAILNAGAVYFHYFVTDGSGTYYSNVVSVTVSKYAAALTLVAAPNTVAGTVTLTATLNGTYNLFDMPINFYVDGVFADVVQTDAGGAAVYIQNGANPSTVYSFYATYSGNDYDTGAVSNKIENYRMDKLDQTAPVFSDSSPITVYYGGAAFQLPAVAGVGAGTTDYVYRSDDASVVSVDATGLATIVDTGTTVIYVKRSGDSVYNDSDESAGLSLTVLPTTPNYATPTSLTAVYGQMLNDVALPSAGTGVWRWADAPATPVGNAGDRVFIAVFTPIDSVRYVSVAVPLTVVVQKAVPVVSVWPVGAAVYKGDMLSASSLTGGNANITGTFGWEFPGDEAAPAGNLVLFTPGASYEDNYIEAHSPVGLTIIDKSVLDSLIAGIPTVTAAAILGDGNGQTPQSAFDALEAALAAARTVAMSIAAQSSQKIVNDAASALQNAIITFENALIIFDFTELEDLIAQADDLISAAIIGAGDGQYTQVVYDAFEAAITNAKTFLAGVGVGLTTNDLLTAVNALKDATNDFMQSRNIIYGILLDAPGHDLDAPAGYSSPPSLTVAVINIGSVATGALTIGLSGADAMSFTLSKTSITDIAASDSDSFTVTPNTGLGAGTYAATITVAGVSGISETFNVSFTVVKAAQTLTAANIVRTVGDGDVDLSSHATSTAGADSGAITYAVTTAGAGASISGATLSYASAGTAIITATAAGNAIYNGATATFTLTVSALPTYAFTVTAGAGGTVSGTSNGSYAAGTPVSVTALTDNGWSFVDWTVIGVTLTDNTDGTATFSMPANPVSLTANWSYNGGGSGTTPSPISPTPTPESKYDDGATAGMGGAGNTSNAPEDAAIILEHDTPLDYYINVENPFEDVFGSDWFYDSVMYVYARGLMIGTSAQPMLFSPYATITRGMIVTILYRLAGEPNPEFRIRNSELTGSNNAPDSSLLTPDFTDVPDGMYYSDAVAWAASVGIINGYGDGRFGPYDPVTRQCLAVIISRYADYMGIRLSVVSGQQSGDGGNENNTPDSSLHAPIFIDGSTISDYAKDAVERLSKAGIIDGYPDGSFKPQNTATRAEAAAMIMRFIEAMG